MQNKPLLPSFSKAMIKRQKATGFGKNDLIRYADMHLEAIVMIAEDIEQSEQAHKNTLELIDEIYSDDSEKVG